MAELVSKTEQSPTADVDVGSTEVDSGHTALAVMEQSGKTALTTEQRARAEALADQALAGDLDALKTFEAEVPQVLAQFHSRARRQWLCRALYPPAQRESAMGKNLCHH